MENKAMNNGRLYPRQPICGAGAVVLNKGRILLIKRGKEPGKGKWSIPGGGIELGETIFEAVKREVREECSVEIEIERIIDTRDNIIKDADGRIRFHYILIDLRAKYVSGSAQAMSDAEACGWFTPAEAVNMDITPSLRAMLLERRIIK